MLVYRKGAAEKRHKGGATPVAAQRLLDCGLALIPLSPHGLTPPPGCAFLGGHTLQRLLLGSKTMSGPLCPYQNLAKFGTLWPRLPPFELATLDNFGRIWAYGNLWMDVGQHFPTSGQLRPVQLRAKSSKANLAERDQCLLHMPEHGPHSANIGQLCPTSPTIGRTWTANSWISPRLCGRIACERGRDLGTTLEYRRNRGCCSGSLWGYISGVQAARAIPLGPRCVL